MSHQITHSGIIECIEGDRIVVKIVQQSACSGCHAQSLCSASEKKEKRIELQDHTGQYRIGEEVRVCGQTSLGLQAVLLAFVFPLLLVVGAIVAGTSLQWSETTNGLIGMALLIPYYSLLYRLRDRLKRRFVFSLEKLN